MTSSWDTIITASGDILRATTVNQIIENITAATEQMSGAPHARLPFMGTDSRDAWTLLSSAAAVIFNPDIQQYEGYNPVTDQWGTIGGGKSFATVIFSAHGYTESGDTGIPLYWTGSLSQSDASTPTAAEVLGVLSKVVDVNKFELQQTGPLTLAHSRWNDVFSGGIVQGNYYYLQGSGLGTYMDEAPATVGWFEKRVLFAIDSATGFILNEKGAVVEAVTGLTTATSTFDLSDITSSFYTFTHCLYNDVPDILLFTSSLERVLAPSAYSPASGNTLNATILTIDSDTQVDIGSGPWVVRGT